MQQLSVEETENTLSTSRSYFLSEELLSFPVSGSRAAARCRKRNETRRSSISAGDCDNRRQVSQKTPHVVLPRRSGRNSRGRPGRDPAGVNFVRAVRRASCARFIAASRLRRLAVSARPSTVSVRVRPGFRTAGPARFSHRRKLLFTLDPASASPA